MESINTSNTLNEITNTNSESIPQISVQKTIDEQNTNVSEFNNDIINNNILKQDTVNNSNKNVSFMTSKKISLYIDEEDGPIGLISYSTGYGKSKDSSYINDVYTRLINFINMSLYKEQKKTKIKNNVRDETNKFIIKSYRDILQHKIPVVEIHSIYVIPKYRKNGYGTLLLNKLMYKLSKKFKCKYIPFIIKNPRAKMKKDDESDIIEKNILPLENFLIKYNFIKVNKLNSDGNDLNSYYIKNVGVGVYGDNNKDKFIPNEIIPESSSYESIEE